jgi:hypothetical protein
MKTKFQISKIKYGSILCFLFISLLIIQSCGTKETVGPGKVAGKLEVTIDGKNWVPNDPNGIVSQRDVILQGLLVGGDKKITDGKESFNIRIGADITEPGTYKLTGKDLSIERNQVSAYFVSEPKDDIELYPLVGDLIIKSISKTAIECTFSGTGTDGLANKTKTFTNGSFKGAIDAGGI